MHVLLIGRILPVLAIARIIDRRDGGYLDKRLASASASVQSGAGPQTARLDAVLAEEKTS